MRYDGRVVVGDVMMVVCVRRYFVSEGLGMSSAQVVLSEGVWVWGWGGKGVALWIW